MPSTPIYGLPYEAESDQPGVSLRAPGPILAEAVETELERIDTDVADITGEQLPAVEEIASRMVTLDRLVQSNTNLTTFEDIDQGYDDLMLLWRGNHDGSGIVSLAVRVNGDGGTDSYRSQTAHTNTDDWTFSESQDASLLRAGTVGSAVGCCGLIVIPRYAVNGIKSMWGHGHGRNVATWYHFGTGRWQAANDPITSIRIWPSGQNWAAIEATLIGIRH